MPITDLTGTKWIIKDNPSIAGVSVDFFIDFISNDINYIWMAHTTTSGGDMGKLRYVSYDGSSYTPTVVLSMATTLDEPPVYTYTWTNDNYKTIEITGGTDATNSTLITWILANATQIEPEVTPVPSSFSTLKYDSSTKTLVINGINYVLDSSASGNSVISTSFSNIALTEEGVLTIDGVSINLPLYSVTPENSILMSDGTYLVDVNEDYITTTEV